MSKCEWLVIGQEFGPIQPLIIHKTKQNQRLWNEVPWIRLIKRRKSQQHVRHMKLGLLEIHINSNHDGNLTELATLDGLCSTRSLFWVSNCLNLIQQRTYTKQSVENTNNAHWDRMAYHTIVEFGIWRGGHRYRNSPKNILHS